MITSGLTYALIGFSSATAFLSGIAGMGGGMLLMGAIIWILPIGISMIIHGAVQAVSNGYRAFLHRQHIMLSILKPYFLGAAVTFVIFSALAITLTKAYIFILLGLAPLLTLLPKRLFNVNILDTRDAVLCGMLVTILQLTAGVSGGVLDIFYLNRDLTRYQVIATKAFTQTVGHITKLFYFGFVLGYGTLDAFNKNVWILFIGMIVMTFIGTRTSKTALKHIKDHHFFTWTRAFIVIFGFVYIARGIALL